MVFGNFDLRDPPPVHDEGGVGAGAAARHHVADRELGDPDLNAGQVFVVEQYDVSGVCGL
jgi:hypothetical protein